MFSSENEYDVYMEVVDDVIKGLDEIFVEEGLDDHVLQDLKHIWLDKIKQANAVDLPKTKKSQNKSIKNNFNVSSTLNNNIINNSYTININPTLSTPLSSSNYTIIANNSNTNTKNNTSHLIKKSYNIPNINEKTFVITPPINQPIAKLNKAKPLVSPNLNININNNNNNSINNNNKNTLFKTITLAHNNKSTPSVNNMQTIVKPSHSSLPVKQIMINNSPNLPKTTNNIINITTASVTNTSVAMATASGSSTSSKAFFILDTPSTLRATESNLTCQLLNKITAEQQSHLLSLVEQQKKFQQQQIIIQQQPQQPNQLIKIPQKSQQQIIIQQQNQQVLIKNQQQQQQQQINTNQPQSFKNNFSKLLNVRIVSPQNQANRLVPLNSQTSSTLLKIQTQQIQQQLQQQQQQLIQQQQNIQQQQPSQQQQTKNSQILQLDGTGRGLSEDEEEEEEEEDIFNQADEDDDYLDDEEEVEEMLNSEDDISIIDPSELFDVDDVILCLYDKVIRNKNKWKLLLKEGVMSIKGKDKLFNKAFGDADWDLGDHRLSRQPSQQSTSSSSLINFNTSNINYNNNSNIILNNKNNIINNNLIASNNNSILSTRPQQDSSI